ncbi:MAG: heme-copper oxidase subunit III [Streptosporangiales bacterium]|nr:heme-copper oxidase subunit III [Streptosporangiales bacterium]
MADVATATAIDVSPPERAQRPNIVRVGTIIWLSSEVMFFAALFAMYFTIRSVQIGAGAPWPPIHLDVPYDTVITIDLVLSSVTCQFAVFAAERGDVRKVRLWILVTFLMGAAFVGAQAYEYTTLILHEGLTMGSSAFGSVFYITTGFHGMHVTGGLIAFLFLLGRTYAAKRYTHEQATSAVVVSYYWHFVDVVWIGLFTTIFLIQ